MIEIALKIGDQERKRCEVNELRKQPPIDSKLTWDDMESLWVDLG